MVDNLDLNSSEFCSINTIHQDIIEKVAKKMPDTKSLEKLAEFFKIFGDLTRIRILWALSESEMCVCDIATLLNASQSSISHQLRILKQNALVKNRKDGKVVYYSLEDEHIKEIFSQGFIHINEK